MKLIYYLIFLIQYIFICKCSKIKLKAVSFSYDNGIVPNYLAHEFNKYAEEKNLDIELSILLYTEKNSTLYVNDYGSTIEYLLRRGSTKYDIYFYDNMYSQRYSQYLINLEDYLSKDHIALYSSGIASETCRYNKKWVGLSNMEKLYQKLGKNC
jgi:hypothetical protein